MFGHRIGETVVGFDRQTVWFGFGLPWVEAKPHEAATEFGRLQILVSPFTGTILGLRAIADFKELTAADAFAQRMDAALSAKFGQDILFHADFGVSCPDDERYVCTILPPEIDLYMARIADYQLKLSRYDNYPDDPTVYLTFVVDESKPQNNQLLNQLEIEYNKYLEWSKYQLILREKDTTLKGIE